MCSDLLWNGVEVAVMWIPFHVEPEGNELVDKQTRRVALNGAVMLIDCFRRTIFRV
jgi:hypothetical protein